MIRIIEQYKDNNGECIVKVNSELTHNIEVSKDNNKLYIDFKSEPKNKQELINVLKELIK